MSTNNAVTCETCGQRWPRSATQSVAVELLGECMACLGDDVSESDRQRVAAIARDRASDSPLGGFVDHKSAANDPTIRLPDGLAKRLKLDRETADTATRIRPTLIPHVSCAASCRHQRRGVCAAPGRIAITTDGQCGGREE